MAQSISSPYISTHPMRSRVKPLAGPGAIPIIFASPSARRSLMARHTVSLV